MGFSIIGTSIAIVMILPSILFFSIFPPKDIQKEANDEHNIYTFLERVGQIGCFLLLIMSKHFLRVENINIWTVLMAICIVLYYALWIRYVLNGQDSFYLCKSFLFIPIPLAVLPVGAFFFASLWGKYIWLGLSTTFLAIGHLKVTWNSWKQVMKE